MLANLMPRRTDSRGFSGTSRLGPAATVAYWLPTTGAASPAKLLSQPPASPANAVLTCYISCTKLASAIVLAAGAWRLLGQPLGCLEGCCQCSFYSVAPGRSTLTKLLPRGPMAGRRPPVIHSLVVHYSHSDAMHSINAAYYQSTAGARINGTGSDPCPTPKH